MLNSSAVCTYKYPSFLFGKLVKEEGGCYARLELVRVFACDMRKLLAAHPDGIEMSRIPGYYKSMFGHDLVVKNYGFNKLAKAMEAIPDVVEVMWHCS